MALTSGHARRSHRRQLEPRAPGARSRARAAAPWALGLLLVVAPELLGGVYPWAMALTAASAGVALALALGGAGREELAPPLLVAVALVPWLWTALQVVPWPCAWTAAVAPLSAQRLREAHALLELPAPSYCPLSRDPGATREELLKGLAIASAMLAGGMMGARGRHRSVFLGVGVSTAALALVSFGHLAVDAKRVFGLYEPFELRDLPFVSPLLNLNTLGGLLAMGVPVWIGLALDSQRPSRRAVALACVALVAGGALMTRSRGAAGAVALGAALFAVLYAMRVRSSRRGHDPRSRRTWPDRIATPLAVASALAVATYAWLDELVVEFRSSGWDKLELIQRAARFALESPWIGVGRGGFGNAFVGSVPTNARFDYAESVLVQWACDWGIPIALLLTLGFVALLARAVREVRSNARIGALVGVCVIATQNLVDLGLELAGPATVAAALLGAAVTRVRPRTAHRLDVPVHVLSWLVAVAAVIAPASMVVKLSAEHAPSVEQELLAGVQGPDRQAFAERLHRAVLAHPSEPMLPLIAGHEALAHGDPAAGRWINRTMLLAPGWPQPHVQAVQWLWRSGRRAQALVELREAFEHDPHSLGAMLCSIARAMPDAVTASAPSAPPLRERFLENVARCLPLSSPQAQAIDARLRALQGRHPEAHEREAMRLLQAGKPLEAFEEVKRSLAITPDGSAAALAVRTLMEAKRYADALAFIEQALEGRSDPIRMLEARARIHAATGDRAGLDEALAALRGRAASNAASLAAAFRFAAGLYAELGDRGAALYALEEANRAEPTDAHLRAIAQAAERLGDRRRALRAYVELCSHGGPGSTDCAALDAARKRFRQP